MVTRGRDSGWSGEPGGVTLVSGSRLRGKGTHMTKAGERLLVHTPEGGGYGDPTDPEPERVKAGGTRGLVSARAATEIYRLNQ